MSPPTGDLIAIVGRGCVVPGALDPDEFWENVASGRCSISPNANGSAGSVAGFETVFDAGGFAVARDQIEPLDPLFHWPLHAGRQALREAGFDGRPLPRAGLVLGNLSYPSAGLTRFAEQIWRDDPGGAPTDPRNRFSSGLPAQFAAEALGLGLGGFALDAACASALYAIKLGCDRLHDGAADLILAGAVTCPDRLLIREGFRALSAASPTGRSRPFHRGADGLVPGEGAVLVALMRLGDALRDGRPILGVIRGIGLSNDGRSGGLLAPAEAGQTRAMHLAYAEAGLPAESVSLVECHATGTAVGDAVEARSMARVFAGSTDLAIGSAKSNIGHLLAAAGGAGLLKVLGAFRAGVRPPSLAADDPIEELRTGPLRLLTALEPWPGPHRAAVSAFGFGGTNAHLIVDAWEPGGTPSSRPGPGRASPPGPLAITALAARVGNGGTEDFRRALLLGEQLSGARDFIDLTVAGLHFPPRDLEEAHAQQVLLLETAREAAEGLPLPRERTMVVVGMGTDPEVCRYPVQRRAAPEAEGPPLSGAQVLGTMPNLVANRVNVQLGLGGPGFTVSAEEASGLVALRLAGRALRAGDVDAAIVGAVDLSCEPVHEAALRALGRDRPTSDAAVVLVIERLADAHRDGHPVIAVLDDDPPAVDATGSGVEFGGQMSFDPAGLFGAPHAATGLLAVAVAATAIQHRAIPGLGRPAVPVAGELVADVTAETLGRSPVSVRLRPGAPAVPWTPDPAPRVRVYSGRDRAEVLDALEAGRESTAGPARLAVVVDIDTPPALEPVRVRAARQWLTRGAPRPEAMAYRDSPLVGEVAFVFTNGSAAYPGMGAELALAIPEIADGFEARGTGLRLGSGEPPATALGHGDAGAGVLDRIWGAALLSGFQVAISRDLLGVRPDAAIGYSSGESAALAALGAWSDVAALRRDLYASSLLTTELAGEFRAVREVWRSLGLTGQRWSSHLASAPADQIRAALAGEPAVHVMAVVAPETFVIGGEATACETVLGRLGAAPVFPIDYPVAAHAPELNAVREEYRALHHRPTADVPGVRFYSGASGEAYRASADRAADAIVAQAVGTIDFVRVIERAWNDGVRVFVEHGPQSQCTGWIRRILAGREHLAVALDAPTGRPVRRLALVTAELMAAGVPVNAQALPGPVAQPPRNTSTAVLRLPAHPGKVRLPTSEPGVTIMPRAPWLPPMPPLTGQASTEPMPATLTPGPAPTGPVPATLGPGRAPAGPRPGTLAHAVAAQFQRVSELHREHIALLAEAHAGFLRTAGLSLAAAPSGPAQPPLVPMSSPPTGPPPAPARPSVPAGPRGPRFDRAQLEHLAGGRVSDLLGPGFAALDDRPRQTRLPQPPMLLVDRVTGIGAVPDSMGTGTIWTETDVAADAWYLDSTGRMPSGLMVEAGQADLLLISYLGVDLSGAGDRVYRLLGCELTYHGSPPAAGETLRFEIQIDGHAEHGGVRLFFFHYDCWVDGELRMTVRGGQAGFFTDDELTSTPGLAWEPGGVEPGAMAEPVALPADRRFGPEAVRAFAEGRPAECFGPAWAKARAHVRSPRIDTGRMLLLDEVTGFDPARGYLRAETMVSADDWFFAGHFKNDPCMPGTLMFEGGLQAMAFYLAALGFTIERDGWRYEPATDQVCELRCRGQVGPTSHKIVYEVFVSELSGGPYPTLYADVLGTVDGVKAFHAHRAGLRLVPDWPFEQAERAAALPVPDQRAVLAGGVRQDQAALLACATGRFTRAMGPAFERFDGHRRAPRLPGPPYHFMTRILAVDGPLGGMRVGSAVTAEYEIPAGAWYFRESGADTMPLAVLMEVALQPCGWLAMYVGSVLDSPADLLFRNLDGTATVRREVRPGLRALRTRVEVRDISRFGDTIIESFTVSCVAVGGPDDGAVVLEAESVFGFFPAGAFDRQPGLPPSTEELARLNRPTGRMVDLRSRRQESLAGPMLLMLDRVTDYRPGGGSAGLGWLRAEKEVDPGEWFFAAHFFQDPVQPGSLGVQAMGQLLNWYLLDRMSPAGPAHPRFEPLMTDQPITWKYRGQVVPADRLIVVELEVTATGTDARGSYATADGWLWVDGRRIYQVTGLGARIAGVSR